MSQNLRTFTLAVYAFDAVVARTLVVAEGASGVDRYLALTGRNPRA